MSAIPLRLSLFIFFFVFASSDHCGHFQEMKLALASATKDSAPTKEVILLRDECERLQIQLEADREIKVCVSFPSTKHSLSRWK
uniref:Secreted protein n=1 Tax=Ascaris lumbricoides TaxID=6252 RepID=A0A0M3HJC5_ASCLU